MVQQSERPRSDVCAQGSTSTVELYYSNCYRYIVRSISILVDSTLLRCYYDSNISTCCFVFGASECWRLTSKTLPPSLLCLGRHRQTNEWFFRVPYILIVTLILIVGIVLHSFVAEPCSIIKIVIMGEHHLVVWILVVPELLLYNLILSVVLSGESITIHRTYPVPG